MDFYDYLQNHYPSKYDITFFIPCLNEENLIVLTLETLREAVGERDLTYEILVFDDHSTDRTVPVVEAYMKEHPESTIRLIKNETQKGLGRNYVDGSYLGRGKHYMLVCGDNNESKDTLLAILDKMGTADIVLPYMGNRDSRPFVRRALSYGFKTIVNFLSGFSVKYYNGPSIHLRVNVMRWHPDTDGFGYQAEMINRLLIEGATYVEVPIRNVDRRGDGSQAFNMLNYLSVSHSLFQVLLRRIRRQLFKK